MGSRQTGVQEVSSQQGQVEDKTQPAGEFWRLLPLMICTDDMQRTRVLPNRHTSVVVSPPQLD